MRTITRSSLAVFALVLCGSAIPAGAQSPGAAPAVAAAKAEPYFVVTSRDGVEMWSGAAKFYYPTASLKAGTRLKVIGEDSGYLRVMCPDDTKACMAVDNAVADATGKTVKVSKLNAFKHLNLRSGVPFAAISFADKEPDVGTELKLLDTMKGADGKPAYYVVAAPAGATAFVNKDQVRKLTPEEVAAVAAKPADAPATIPTGDATKPADSTKPADAAKPADATTPPAATTPAATTPPAPVKVDPPKVDPRKAEFDALIETFKRVQAQPLAEAEFDQAIGQFNALIAKLGDSPSDRRLAQRLGGYVEVLKIRLDLRNAMSANAANDAKVIEQKITQLSETFLNLERQGFFKVIGRLLPSTVYDGTRLPKLYRVVSPEPGASRTLAYILPAPGLELDAKLGRIVGVVGESKMDESLKANLVTPKRVEVINLTPAGNAGEPAAPAANPAGSAAPAGQ